VAEFAIEAVGLILRFKKIWGDKVFTDEEVREMMSAGGANWSTLDREG